jgi:hypothetical protein
VRKRAGAIKGRAPSAQLRARNLFSERMTNLVYAIGIMNPPGLADDAPTSFDLTRAEVAMIADSAHGSTALLVDHDYVGMSPVGVVSCFWTDAAGFLWGMAVLNPDTDAGRRTIRRLATGELQGFSLGIPFDTETLRTEHTVVKFGLVEVSMVAAPDIECTRIVSLVGMAPFAAWAPLEEYVRAAYAATGQSCPTPILDALFADPSLWPMLATLCEATVVAAM